MSTPDLSAADLDRYSRHIIMEDIGGEGQQALLDSSVIIIGAGGLGSPIIQYLAAAGIGTLTIVDDDVVERSNLQRQVIHGEADIGRPKVRSAQEFVADLNPAITVEPVEKRVDSESVQSLIAGHDVVVDATDNFPTRYLLNDACTLAGLPLVHGAIYQFEGQVATFTGDGPCYRCLFPEAPEEGVVPDCATAGVLGVLPGTVGCMQATEVLKLCADVGTLLDGRMLYYDAKGMTVEEIPIAADPDCPVCGDQPAIESLQDVEYTERCSVSAD